MNTVEISEIKKSYGKKKVLNGVSLSSSGGICIGILGGNGCGKSTFLNILAGVLKRDSGEFLYNGYDLFKNPKKRAETVGFVPQSMPLFDDLTAKENLLLWYSRSKMKRELDGGVLSMLGINEFINVKVKKMSGGMKKRLSIGCAVHSSPEILLLDEPSAALDLVCKEQVLNYISDFKSRGKTAIVATHDIAEIEFCDVLYLFKNGILTEYAYDGNLNNLVKML